MERPSPYRYDRRRYDDRCHEIAAEERILPNPGYPFGDDDALDTGVPPRCIDLIGIIDVIIRNRTFSRYAEDPIIAE